MSQFQIIMIIVAILGLLSGIVGVYIKTQIDIAKIQTQMLFIQKDLDTKEGSILRLEEENRQDHKEIMKKIDTLIERNYAEE